MGHLALVLKAQEKNESSSDDKPLPKGNELEASNNMRDLFRIIIGFAAGIYGFLALLQPEKYNFGSVIPSGYVPIVGLFLLILGALMLLKDS